MTNEGDDLGGDLGSGALNMGDRPLSDPADDRLGYAPFAKMLATSVLRGCPADGLVVGVYGAWGLGKSTLLNFIAHEVEQDPESTPIVIRFNPWWFSSREDLIRRFFKEFELAALRKGARNKAIVEAAQKLGEAASNFPISMVANIGKTVASFAKLAQPGDIAGLKKALSQALAERAFRVLVLVDDIDRLLPDDMLEVFRVIKAVGDLPNVIYVLAFDREASARALTERFGEFGARYLEKIVQVQFDLPVPRRSAVQGIFSERLSKLLANAPPELVDEARLARLYQEAIEPLLRTPRDVIRLLNAVSVTLPAVVRDVDIVDFLGLETLRLYFPTAYETVRRDASHFVGIHAAISRSSDDAGRQREGQFHERWLQALGESRPRAEALLKALFPGVLPGHSGRGQDASALRKARRVCTEEHFEKYIQYGLASDELSRDEFLRIAELGTDAAVVSAVTELAQLGPHSRMRMREFLETLRDHLDTPAPFRSAGPFIRALSRVGDQFMEGARQREPFAFGDEFLLAFVVEELLRRMPEGERTLLLIDALGGAGVSTVVRIVGTLASQHGRLGESQPLPASERVIRESNDIDVLQSYALSRIQEASKSSLLWEAPGLVRNLFMWRLLGEEIQMREWVARATLEDAALVKLLGLLVNTRHFLSPHPSQRIEVAESSLAALFDTTALLSRIELVSLKPEWSDEVLSVLRAVQRALKASEGVEGSLAD